MRRLVACVVGVAGACNPDVSGLGGSSTAGTTGGGSSEADVTTGVSTGSEPSSEVGDTSGSMSETSSPTSGTSSSTGSTAADGTSSGSDTGDVPMLPCEGQVELAACYDFVGVGDGMLWDRSGNGNDAAAVGVGVVPGPFGDAATFDDGSEIAVPDSASLDIAGPLTFEAWIHVDALPTGRMGVLDDESQYSLIVYDTDEYRCDMAPGTLYVGPVVLGEWTHVACVYDGAAVRAYVNGSEIGMVAASGPVATRDGEPMSIGDTSPEFDEPFDGAIGGVRVWSRALDASELCEAAGAACGG
jgi:hypothetical protein